MILLLPLSRYKKQALRQEAPDLSGYPKSKKLRDGTKIILRPMQKGDGEKLHQFFEKLEPKAKLFLKDDVADSNVTKEWEDNLDFSSVVPILAFRDDEIIGDATLHRDLHGWSRHVAEIRMVTAHDVRKQGLGLLLARELYFLAQKLHVDKVIAEAMDSQEGAIRVFEKLGFKQEAVLKNAVMDLEGKKHNLVFLTQDIAVLWRKIENLMHDLEDHGG
jgi:RimJ/RimL family protein N-acetyltransferase